MHCWLSAGRCKTANVKSNTAYNPLHSQAFFQWFEREAMTEDPLFNVSLKGHVLMNEYCNHQVRVAASMEGYANLLGGTGRFYVFSSSSMIHAKLQSITVCGRSGHTINTRCVLLADAPQPGWCKLRVPPTTAALVQVDYCRVC